MFYFMFYMWLKCKGLCTTFILEFCYTYYSVTYVYIYIYLFKHEL